ncbi:hypothetical protein [Sphingorhabdus pulchriflava]|nr:hypothetical protein [Sphingorhabdus pulchriflava]
MTEDTLDSKKSEPIALSELLLDAENPRFAGASSPKLEQADVLDHIVKTFGVDDVLSSLSINGYMPAEPIVCRREPGSRHAIVMEGNRRLAACLIIAGDERASRHRARHLEYNERWVAHGSKSIDPIPAIVFEGKDQKKSLLSYLGVRHIASSQGWDSYAKAAWVAQVVEENSLPLADVALMIGDKHNTIKRMLEGFYFVKQAEAAGEFRPSDSLRRGRGSIAEYPFSWVYTFLGYTAARSYLGLDDGEPKKLLVPEANLRRAGVVARAMFGDASKGRSAAIQDSRELGDLASVFSDPDKISLLENGKSVAEIARLTKPIEDRLREGLSEVRSLQSEIVSGISEQQLEMELAESLVGLSNINRRTAEDIAKRVEAAARGES